MVLRSFRWSLQNTAQLRFKTASAKRAPVGERFVRTE